MEPLLDLDAPVRGAADGVELGPPSGHRPAKAAAAERATRAAATAASISDELLLLFGGPFAGTARWWCRLALGAAIGAVVGLVSLLFINLYTKLSQLWLDLGPGDTTYDHQCSAGTLSLGGGSGWWVLLAMGTGLVIGCVKLIPCIRFPDTVRGVFHEINMGRVDPREGPSVWLISCLSIAGGASVGPEAALGCVGGGLGTLVARCLGRSAAAAAASDMAKDDDGLPHQGAQGQGRDIDGGGDDELTTTLALAGMAAALGALFPSPILSVLLVLELRTAVGKGPSGSGALMDFSITNGVAATTSWATYSALQDKTWLTAPTLPLAVYVRHHRAAASARPRNCATPPPNLPPTRARAHPLTQVRRGEPLRQDRPVSQKS